MNLITQSEIIDSVRVDSHFSVNNITDDTIQKAELYLASTFLADDFYADLLSTKTDVATFSNANYQTLYDKYLRRLISEYVMLMSVDEMVLRIANNGINNDEQLAALKYVKESLKDEVDRSKAMIDAYLKNNKSVFTLYKQNVQNETEKEIPRKNNLFGFLREEDVRTETEFIKHIYYRR